jgi:FecR protein
MKDIKATMGEEVVEPGSATAARDGVPTKGEPPRRPRRRSNANLYSALGLLAALVSAGVYFFFFLRPAQQRALEEVARFSTLEGDVKVKPSATQQWKPAKNAMILAALDVVQTAPEAGAELLFKTGNVVRLRPDSIVLIGDTADTSEATWRVQSGQVNFELTQNTQIATPTATTKTTGSAEGNISVLDDGLTGIKIFKGTAQVATAKGDQITLMENEAVKVDAQGKAGKKSVLPNPPVTVAPLPQAQVPFKTRPQTIARLEWKPVAGGASYRVAVDYNVVQANLLLSAALDAPGISAAFHDLAGLDPGKYYWRVAGVNEEGEEGKYSRVSNFVVVPQSQSQVSPPPTPAAAALTLQPLEVMGSVVALRGRAAPGSTVTVDGIEIKVGPDGSFSEFLKRGDRRVVTIKVTGPGGEVTEETRPVS